MGWFRKKKRRGVVTGADVLKSLNDIADDIHNLTAMIKCMNDQDAKR